MTVNVDADVKRTLDAIAYTTGRTIGQIVADGVARELAGLSEPQRADLKLALRLAAERDRS